MSNIAFDQTIAGATDEGALSTEESGGVAESASLEKIEIAQAWNRLTKGASAALGLWLSFFGADFFMATWVYPGSLSTLATLRFSSLAVLLVCVIVLRKRKRRTQRILRILDCTIFMTSVLTLSLMCLPTGGIVSPFYAGITLVFAVRTALVAEPWRRGIVINAILFCIFPGVIIGSAMFSDSIASQFSNSGETVTFIMNCNLLLGVATLAVVGGDALWRTRRHLFESRSIGRYRLLRRIGKGGMGEIWAAWHKGLSREVAIKLLTPQVDESQAVRRFEREVQATVSLSHPNTIRVFDHGSTDDGIWFYAMELLRGENLSVSIQREGKFSVERAVYIISQVAQSIAEAHARNIHHRDIKPENIFLTDDGRVGDFVKVLDFGIARVPSDLQRDDVGLTATGSTLGTPAYLSPEAARGHTSDARCDVYGLGAVLYFMLTEHPPAQGRNFAEIIDALMHSAPPAISKYRDENIPAELELVIATSLAKDPDDRYRDASEFLTALARCACFDAWQPPPVDLVAFDSPS